MTVRRILVPFDFSAHSSSALEAACSLCSQLKADLHLVYVAEGELDSEIQRLAMERLMMAVPPAVELQCSIHREVLFGGIQSEILAYASRSQVDLIVVGTHGRSGLARLALGSVSERLLKSATCPVVVVRSDSQKNESVKRNSETCISSDASRIQIWIVPTNEEIVVAKQTAEVIKALSGGRESPETTFESSESLSRGLTPPARKE